MGRTSIKPSHSAFIFRFRISFVGIIPVREMSAAS
jgi:hypothetical protein